MKYLLPFFSFFFVIPLAAQKLTGHQLDSLYVAFTEVKITGGKTAPLDQASYEPENIKCGFGLVNTVRDNFENFTPEQQQVLKILLTRPQLQASMVSPSGFFRIHYNRTGSDIPRYNPLLSPEQNVELVGTALDSVYSFEVNHLGFNPPPPDESEGGDNRYDVYLIDYGGMYYGETVSETSTGNGRRTSYIQIDNDYSGYPTDGPEGMQVTVAHEFHHSIQVGGYTASRINEDLFFYELSATAMEEFVFDSINDYYFYMNNYFYNTGRSFSENNGYNIAIWNIFLADKFGYNIIRRQWELLPEKRALDAINTSIIENNSNFRDIFHEFGVWTFFTGHRAKQNQYFDESAAYPLIRTTNLTFNSPQENVTIDSKPNSNSFISFINSGTTPDDTITVLISNGEINISASSLPVDYTLYDYNAQGSRKLNDNFNYYALFNADQLENMGSSEFLNNELIGSYTFTAEYDYAFPTPFKYNTHNFIFIPISSPENDNADLNIYTASMDLVYSVNRILERRNNQTGITWDVMRNDRQKLASGIYIYAIRSGNKTSIGKLVIINE